MGSQGLAAVARAFRVGRRGGVALAALGLALTMMNLIGHDVGWYQAHSGLVYGVVLGGALLVLLAVGYATNTPKAPGVLSACAGALAGLIGLLGFMVSSVLTTMLANTSSPDGLLGAAVYSGIYLGVPLVLGGGVLALLGAYLSGLRALRARAATRHAGAAGDQEDWRALHSRFPG